MVGIGDSAMIYEIAVVTDDAIDDRTLRDNLPSSTKYLVCKLDSGKKLMERLDRSGDPRVFNRTRGDGYRIFNGDLIGIGEYRVDNTVYSIWCPGNSLQMFGLDDNKEKLDSHIRAAFQHNICQDCGMRCRTTI
jgi:hypothetical protein